MPYLFKIFFRLRNDMCFCQRKFHSRRSPYCRAVWVQNVRLWNPQAFRNRVSNSIALNIVSEWLVIEKGGMPTFIYKTAQLKSLPLLSFFFCALASLRETLLPLP